MRNKSYIILGSLLFCLQVTFAQTNFLETDSVSKTLYANSKWKELISYGSLAIAKGDDFPDLRLRIAYAAFKLENYSQSLMQYEQVLMNDKYNQIALYHAYLCNIYLNRFKEASYLIKYIDGKSIDGKSMKPFAVNLVGAEHSAKFTDAALRGNPNFTRVFTQLRANYDLHIDFSVMLFNQNVNLIAIQQTGSHIKFAYQPARNLNVFFAWNYNNTNTGYESNLIALGLKYIKPFYFVEAEASLANNVTAKTTQANFQLFNYLTGNLDLYLSNRISYLNTNTTAASSSSFIYNPLIGFKPFDKLWAELSGTFGNQQYYAEANGLYQYNGIDATKIKFNAQTYYLLKKHLILSVGYGLEKKTENLQTFDYLQHSINIAITWNF